MPTLTSTPASMDPVSTPWPVSTTRTHTRRPTWRTVGLVAAAAMVLVASIWDGPAASNSATRSGPVLSANAVEGGVPIAPAPIQSATDAQLIPPLVDHLVQSATAVEQGRG